MKALVAIVSGIIAGLAIWFLGMMVFYSLYPYPEYYDSNDDNTVQMYISSLPTKAFIILIVRDALAIFAAGLAGSIIGNSFRFQSGLIAMMPFLIYSIYTYFTYTYPTYFVVTNLGLQIVLGFVAVLFGGSRIFR